MRKDYDHLKHSVAPCKSRDTKIKHFVKQMIWYFVSWYTSNKNNLVTYASLMHSQQNELLVDHEQHCVCLNT